MSDTDERLKSIEKENEEFRFKLHAAQVAITAISVVINNRLDKEPGMLAAAIEQSMDKPFFKEHPNHEYFDKLKLEVAQLLGKIN